MEHKRTRQETINQFELCREMIDTYITKMDKLAWEIIRWDGDIHSEEAEIGWNMLEVTELLTKYNETDITLKRR